MPDMKELKEVVFSMSPHSASVLDGMNGRFFQASWTIINKDLLKVVQTFLCPSTSHKLA